MTVDFATADGTAKKGLDYAERSGTVTIPAGATSETITVPLMKDGVNELSETFFVNLSNAAGAPITDAQTKGTILNVN